MSGEATRVHARRIPARQRLQAVRLASATAAGTVLRGLLQAFPALAGTGLVSAGAGLAWGLPAGLMAAGGVMLADAVWERVS